MNIKFIKCHGSSNDFVMIDMITNQYNFDEEIDLWHYPVETISLSEKGVEKIYQGTAFLFVKKCDFSDEKKLGFTVEFFHNSQSQQNIGERIRYEAENRNEKSGLGNEESKYRGQTEED